MARVWFSLDCWWHSLVFVLVLRAAIQVRVTAHQPRKVSGSEKAEAFG
jgi:hypothetical protein